MLISLSIENFKSIGKEASISMLPGRYRSLQNHVLEGDILKTCAIFGENGSGKSTIIQALNYLRCAILGNYSKSGECLLHKDGKKHPIIMDLVMSCRINLIDRIIRDSGTSDKLGLNMISPNDHVFRYRVQINPDSSTVFDEKIWYIEGTHELLIFDSNEDDTIESTDEVSHEAFMEEDRLIDDKRKELNSLIKKMNELRLIKNEATISSGEMDLEDSIIRENFKVRINNIDAEIESTEQQYKELSIEFNDLKKHHQQIYKKWGNPNRPVIKNLLISHASHNIGVKPDYELTQSELDAQMAIRTWLLNTLEIIDTHGLVLESLDSNELRKLSTIVSKFDTGVEEILWEEIVEPMEVWSIMNETQYSIQERPRRRMVDIYDVDSSYSFSTASGIYKIENHRGINNLYQLVSRHKDGKTFPINMESDGTRRIIELASILIPTNEDHVYFVDELDYRLHPVLVKKFLDMFYQCESKGHKQIIFTTHETNLMSRDLFRLDEIWMAEQDDDGSSEYLCVADMGKKITKRLDELYLKDRILGGVPEIRDP